MLEKLNLFNLKLPLRKLVLWFILWSFFLVRLLCIFLNLSYNHAWKILLSSMSWYSCYLELLDNLQKQIYRTVGSSLAAFLEPLVYCWNVASLSLFYGYFFNCYLAVPQPTSGHSQGDSLTNSMLITAFWFTLTWGSPEAYYFGRYSSELAQLGFHFLILEGGLLVILIDSMTFCHHS